ncbi:MAG: hypothetical protein H3C49_11790 [Alphaproteobacteria bacterium]|nr:hypothetical protein [Alphaproteobacteria bacterium]HRI75760.1 hypothetical protein [Alphaproteobacteria bacterium]
MASCPVRLSLWRGVAGFSLLIASFIVFPHSPIGFVALMLGALYFFKGCPACWISGLNDAIQLKKKMAAGEKDSRPPAAPPTET